MALNKIKDLIYELDEIDADIEDLEMYASMAIEKNLKVNVDFTFFDGVKEQDQEQEQEMQQVSFLSNFFYASSTSPNGSSKNDQWSMVKTIDQSMMLRMFGIMMDDMTKKRQSVINKLKRLGINERATNTIKKN
jgi:hypothetical protein